MILLHGVLGLLAFLAPQAVDTTPPAFLDRPALVVGPNPSTPLAVRLTCRTSEPTRIQVFADDGTRTWSFFPDPGYRAQHDLALAGFRASRTHALRLVAFDAAGNRTPLLHTLRFRTPALPAEFPPLHVTVANASQMEPGVTLTAFHSSSPTLPNRGTYIVYLDAAGQVVWLHHSLEKMGNSAIRLRNGHLFTIVDRSIAREIDLLGNTVAQWFAARQGAAGMPPGAIPVDCDSFHHELDQLPVGFDADYVALSNELRTYPNYPANENDPTQTVPLGRVVGDEVVEFRRSGAIVRRRSLLDVLDPYRVAYNSLAPVLSGLYGVAGVDWSHANTVAIDPADGNWIVSLRNQDAVVKIDRGNGALRWILAPPERWTAPWSQYLLTPVGAPFGWSYHQHAPRMDAAGNIVIYDNGNYRATPPTAPNPPATWYSRAVAYRVNASTGTIQQQWSYDGAPNGFFSRFFCEADPLPITGNVLVSDGWRNAASVNRTYSRVLEIAGNPPATTVFEVIVNDPAVANDPYNWAIYRSQRYAAIHP